MRGFYSSLGLMVLLNVVVKPLWIFAIDRQVQNVVGTEVYGVYFSLLGLSIVLIFLADWGFTAFFNQRLAARVNDFTDLPGRFLVLKLIFSAVYLLVLLAVGYLSGIERWDILGYVALIQIFTSLFLFFRAIITAQQWFRADAWLSVADKSLMIVGCGLLLYVPAFPGTMTIESFLLLQTIFMGVAVLAAFLFLVKKKIHFYFHRKWLPDKNAFKQALPFGIIVLLMAFHSRIDAFLLERIHLNGAYESGIYAAGYRLLDAANMGGYLIASFMLPFIARRWSDKQEINSVILQCRHFLMMFSAGLIATFWFLSPWIEQVMYHHDDSYASEVLAWCLPAIAGYSFVHIYGTVLTATGRVVNFCYIVLAGLVINSTLNFFFIPAWGAKGCCLAAICSQLVCGITAMLYARQKLKTWLHLRSLLIYIFTGLLLSGFYYIGRDWPVAKWGLIIAAMAVTFIIMIVSKLADRSVLLSLGQKNINH